ncbi:MAG: hypothetical protein RLY14_1649 [Planctomycetota bacterium]|jgi:DNA-binding NarL/FixJ family response regulator
MRAYRIILVDDHHLVRSGFRNLVETIEGFDVLADFDSGMAALAHMENDCPDVVLTDLALPDMHGLDLIAEIRNRFPSVKLIVLSVHNDSEYVRRALQLGVDGYLLKTSTADELRIALQSVMANHKYLTPEIANVLVDTQKRLENGNVNALEMLSLRQRQTLKLIAEGNSNKQIANKLHLKIKTIEMHRELLMKKLCIDSVAGLTRFALQHKLID